jgi:hypothetical protein
MAGQNVWIKSGKLQNLLNNDTPVTGNVTGGWVYKDSPISSFQGIVTGSGSITATITIQVSNDGINAVNTSAGVITLSGTAPQSDGFITSNAPWKYVRAVVTGATGTITQVQVWMGV